MRGRLFPCFFSLQEFKDFLKGHVLVTIAEKVKLDARVSNGMGENVMEDCFSGNLCTALQIGTYLLDPVGRHHSCISAPRGPAACYSVLLVLP